MTCQIGWATTSSAFSVGMGAIPPPLTEAILAGATPPSTCPPWKPGWALACQCLANCRSTRKCDFEICVIVKQLNSFG